MKKLICVLITIFSVLGFLNAQEKVNDPISTMNVVLDAKTIGLLSAASANIELKFNSSSSGSKHLYGRFGYASFVENSPIFCSSKGNGLNIELVYLIGRRSSFFELTGGSVFAFMSSDNERSDFITCKAPEGFKAYPSVQAGYRYQGLKSGIIARINFGTLGIGIGLGYALGNYSVK